jgi:predicted transcriptional regulator
MQSTWAFLAGGLLVAAKVLAAAAIGFGIAWWRIRKRLRLLEQDRQLTPATAQRLERIEQTLDSLAVRLDRLLEGHEHLGRLMAEARHALPPGERPATTPPHGPSAARR